VSFNISFLKYIDIHPHTNISIIKLINGKKIVKRMDNSLLMAKKNGQFIIPYQQSYWTVTTV